MPIYVMVMEMKVFKIIIKSVLCGDCSIRIIIECLTDCFIRVSLSHVFLGGGGGEGNGQHSSYTISLHFHKKRRSSINTV